MTFAALFLSDPGSSWLEVWVNLLIGLILDIVVVAVTKAFTRRRRPAQNINDNFLEVSVDKFSFPSGHATRAILLAIFFTYLYPLPLLLFVPVGECFVYQLV